MNIDFEELKEVSKLRESDVTRDQIRAHSLFKEVFKLFVEIKRTEIFKRLVSVVQKQPVMLRQRQ